MISALPAQALMIQYERENIEVLITEALEGYKDKYDLSFDSAKGKLVVTTTTEYVKILSEKLIKYGVNMNVVDVRTRTSAAKPSMTQYERENIEVLITEALEGYKDKYDLSFDSTIGKLVVTTTAEYTKIMSQKLTKYGVNMNVVNMQTIQIPKPKEITSDEGRTIATGNVTVRSGPGTGFKKLGMLKKGRGVSVINANSGWAKIEFGAGHGYVSTTYLNLFHNVEDYAPMIGVASRTASVRSGSSTKNEVVFTFEKGKAVVVVSISGKWAKVNYGFANMKAGYIQVSDLWFNTK
jgi:uncharacterized protein YraI